MWDTKWGQQSEGFLLEIRHQTYCTTSSSSDQPLSKTIQQHTGLPPPPQIHPEHINHVQRPRHTSPQHLPPSTHHCRCRLSPGGSLLGPGWRLSQSLALWVVVWHLLQLRIIPVCVLSHTHSVTHSHSHTSHKSRRANDWDSWALKKRKGNVPGDDSSEPLSVSDDWRLIYDAALSC